MNYAHPEALVSTEWLAAHLGEPNLVVLDGTWFLGEGDGRSEYLKSHIPGAVFFDIDDVADKANPLPHMLPSAAVFSEKVGAMGVSNASHVVVYDRFGLQTAARVWWEFRFFGHDKVSVLDGGLKKWLAEGRKTEAGAARPKPATYRATPHPGLVRSLDQLKGNLTTEAEQVLDARSAGRFKGLEPEPRPGSRPGHIPGSLSLPYTDILDPETRTMAGADALAAKFKATGVDLARPVVTSCGSGVTASVLALGLHLIGQDKFAVYDGSWSEWGTRPDVPVEK